MSHALGAVWDSSTLILAAIEGNLRWGEPSRNRPSLTATIIDGMRPQTVGRVLGAGLRIAGRMAGQRLAGSGNPRPVTVAGVGGPNTSARVSYPPNAREAAQKARKVSTGVARGVGGFLRPFGRVGGNILLEVTGVFFFLFVLIFGTWAWKLRTAYAHGADHTRFLVYAAMTLLFLYLSVSNFWRARRK